ncbi:DsbA family protein [Bacillus salipaludis]|uniref:DsbA family protein n=1 Tax=Bacillus salipaludis TaxID=2547811 RepID=A0AA90QWV5_9BACI|nr:DsbA family protein [Bacillus salipaludis]MDQ6594935.1 DsbA family protein [Bacillus salipaludis]
MSNQKKGSNPSSAKFIFWVVSFVAVMTIGFIFLAPHKSQSTTSPKVESNTGKSSAKIDYTHEPFMGKSSAPVSIIEFGDYKCPACKNLNEKVIPTIKQELVATGKAKLYFMNYSFIYTDSERSAKFAESVYAVLGNKAFWKFHDLLYQKQPDSQYEKMDIYTEKFLTDTLKKVVSEADVKKVVEYFDANKADAAWQKDMDLVKQLNVNGTPTIFVNGKLAKTMDDLKNMVDKAAKEK